MRTTQPVNTSWCASLAPKWCGGMLRELTCTCVFALSCFRADCPWKNHSGIKYRLVCKDGTTCDYAGEAADPLRWGCCSNRGGRHQCPSDSPLMCATPSVAACSGDYCCEPDAGAKCSKYGGLRSCPTNGKSAESMHVGAWICLASHDLLPRHLHF